MERAALKIKKKKVQDLEEKLARAKAFYIVDYNGLGTNEMNDLRRRFKRDDFDYFVVKNTILRLASEKLGLKEISQVLVGPNAISISYDDPVGPAKVIDHFYKEHKLPTIKLCYIEGQWLAADGVRKIVHLPSRDMLIAQVLNLINNPITRFVYLLSNLLTNFVRVLDEIRKGKESKEDLGKEKREKVEIENNEISPEEGESKEEEKVKTSNGSGKEEVEKEKKE